MRKISEFDCKAKAQKPHMPTKTTRKPSKKCKRLKNTKTELQVLTLKYFHDTFCKNSDNADLISQICDFTGFSRRQVYKWFWDENTRRKYRSPAADIELSERIKEAFSEIFDAIKMNIFDVKGMVLKAVYVPPVKMLNEDNNRAVWNLKLSGLASETIFLRPK